MSDTVRFGATRVWPAGVSDSQSLSFPSFRPASPPPRDGVITGASTNELAATHAALPPAVVVTDITPPNEAATSDGDSESLPSLPATPLTKGKGRFQVQQTPPSPSPAHTGGGTTATVDGSGVHGPVRKAGSPDH